MAVDSHLEKLRYERELADDGYSVIAGIDEAGRGPLAGPVVAAAVILPVEWTTRGLPVEWQGVNDSKKLSERKRTDFFDLIQSTAGVTVGVAEISAEEIDRTNILKATHSAMATAIANLTVEPDAILVDGLHVASLSYVQKAIVKGDSLSCSIAAASVIAKVTRDRIMRNYDIEHPVYGFASHKGYGTAAHLLAIREHGPCAIHRKSFAPVRCDQGELFS